MKNCKKILAMMLTLVMVISMCAFTVSADRITHATPSQEEKEIIVWDAEYWSKDIITKDSKAVYVDNIKPESVLAKKFGLVGSSTKGTTISNVVDPLDADNKVLLVKTNLMQSNFRSWFNDETTNAMGDNNVVSFKTRMMVPSGQTDVEDKTTVKRTWQLPFQIKTYDGTTAYEDCTAKISPYITVKVEYNEAKKLVVTAVANESKNFESANLYSDPIVVNEDEYFTINAECYVKDGQNPVIFVYVDDELIYSAIVAAKYNKTETVDGVETKRALGFDLIQFKQTVANAITYVDETKVTAHKVETFPVYSVGTTKQADPIEVAAKGNTSVLTNIGLYGKTIQQSTGTSVATTYSRDTETVPGETLINIHTSGKGLTRFIGNIREPFADIPFIDINATTPTYIVNSMDLYIPSGTESVEREFYFSNKSGVRDEGVSNDTLFKTSSIAYYVVVKGGKLNFKPTLAATVVEKPFVTKAEEVTFPSDKLVNIKIVCEVTGTEAAGYDVKFYGIVDGELAYVSEYTYPAGEFGFSAFNLDIKNSSDKAAAIDTKVDNINIAAYTNYTIPEKTWNLVNYAYPAVVTVNGNTVNAKGLIVNSSTDKLDAVVAFYDVNGKLIAPLAKTTLTKSGSDFSIEANAEIPEGAATAKAFFFDSLATAKPVMKSVKITIE